MLKLLLYGVNSPNEISIESEIARHVSPNKGGGSDKKNEKQRYARGHLERGNNTLGANYIESFEKQP